MKQKTINKIRDVVGDIIAHHNKNEGFGLIFKKIFNINGLKGLEEISKILSYREIKILELRFGLIDGVKRNLEEVGEVFGVTRERIGQIEARSLEKIRRSLS